MKPSKIVHRSLECYLKQLKNLDQNGTTNELKESVLHLLVDQVCIDQRRSI